MVAISFLGGLSSLGFRRKHAPPPPEVQYSDFINSRMQSFEGPIDSPSGTNNNLTTTFSGFIKGAPEGTGLSGKYLNAIIRRGENYTLMLTAIEDPQTLSRKLDKNGLGNSAQYLLQADDFPIAADKIGGYHFLVDCGEKQVAIVLRTKDPEHSKDKDLLGKVLQTVADKCVESGSALSVIRWFISDGPFCTATSKDFGGTLIV